MKATIIILLSIGVVQSAFANSSIYLLQGNSKNCPREIRIRTNNAGADVSKIYNDRTHQAKYTNSLIGTKNNSTDVTLDSNGIRLQKFKTRKLLKDSLLRTESFIIGDAGLEYSNISHQKCNNQIENVEDCQNQVLTNGVSCNYEKYTFNKNDISSCLFGHPEISLQQGTQVDHGKNNFSGEVINVTYEKDDFAPKVHLIHGGNSALWAAVGKIKGEFYCHELSYRSEGKHVNVNEILNKLKNVSNGHDLYNFLVKSTFPLYLLDNIRIGEKCLAKFDTSVSFSIVDDKGENVAAVIGHGEVDTAFRQTLQYGYPGMEDLNRSIEQLNNSFTSRPTTIQNLQQSCFSKESLKVLELGWIYLKVKDSNETPFETIGNEIKKSIYLDLSTLKDKSFSGRCFIEDEETVTESFAMFLQKDGNVQNLYLLSGYWQNGKNYPEQLDYFTPETFDNIIVSQKLGPALSLKPGTIKYNVDEISISSFQAKDGTILIDMKYNKSNFKRCFVISSIGER